MYDMYVVQVPLRKRNPSNTEPGVNSFLRTSESGQCVWQAVKLTHWCGRRMKLRPAAKIGVVLRGVSSWSWRKGNPKQHGFELQANGRVASISLGEKSILNRE